MNHYYLEYLEDPDVKATEQRLANVGLYRTAVNPTYGWIYYMPTAFWVDGIRYNAASAAQGLMFSIKDDQDDPGRAWRWSPDPDTPQPDGDLIIWGDLNSG